MKKLCLLCAKNTEVNNKNKLYINIEHEDGRLFLAGDSHRFYNVAICDDCKAKIKNVTIGNIEWQNTYYDENRERLLDYQKNYNKENKNSILLYQREYQREYQNTYRTKEDVKEYQKKYQQEYRLRKKQERLAEKYLTCQDCGTKDETVRETYCPYAEEINGEQIEVILCQDCYYERCQEI